MRIVLVVYLTVLVVITPVSGTTCLCATTSANVHSGPGTKNPTMAILSLWDCLKDERSTTGSWVKVDYKGQDAWVHGRHVRAGDCQCTCATTRSEVNIRTCASATCSVLRTLTQNHCTIYLGSDIDIWRHVEIDKQEGWVHSSYVTQPQPCPAETPALPPTLMTNGCGFKRTDGVHSFGGKDFPSAMTEDQCMEQCEVDQACAGFDWNPLQLGAKCFLLSQKILTLNGELPGNRHWTKVCSCA